MTCCSISILFIFSFFQVVFSIEYATRTSRSIAFVTRNHHRAHYEQSTIITRLAAVDTNSMHRNGGLETKQGLYKQFADHAWDKLEETGWFQDAATTSTIPDDLQHNEAPAKGTPDSIVKITAKALLPTDEYQDLVRYARVAILETVSSSTSSDNNDDDTSKVQSAGIQVLNFVVFPSNSTSLPVLGIDLVSLPGNRHLLLIDAQPMTDPNPFERSWEKWYLTHVNGNEKFPWGGDFPEPVQKYVSKYALWTRLQGVDDPVSVILNDVWEAFISHLDIYLTLLSDSAANEIKGPNHQASYLDYRKNNDPAKPMLNSLYGTEWTDRILDEVLFPQ